jgi:hypothetical protein
MPATLAEVYETLRSTSEALRRSLPDASMFSTVFLGPCPTQAVDCAVRSGVGGGGHVKVLVNATPTEQL